MDTPGLVKREIIARHEHHVTYREIWDLTVPGCPIIAVSLSPFGLNKSATVYERTVTVPE